MNAMATEMCEKCESLEISWDDKWTIVKLYPQKNDFWAPGGDRTRNLLKTCETL